MTDVSRSLKVHVLDDEFVTLDQAPGARRRIKSLNLGHTITGPFIKLTYHSIDECDERRLVYFICVEVSR